MISVAGVEIPLATGQIAINLSGGADSSLLLYILMLHVKDPIWAFTCVPNSGQNGHATISATVIDRCVELTNNINVHHHTWYQQESNDPVLLWSVESSIMKKLDIKTMYIGTTSNPPDDIENKFVARTEDPIHLDDRDPNRQRSVINDNGIRQFIRPFTNIDKVKIAEMYRELDLIDTLLPLTRSCRALTFRTVHEPCGICWSCKEREWGFR